VYVICGSAVPLSEVDDRKVVWPKAWRHCA